MLGLAAGFDPDGRLIPTMGKWPFGGLEAGSVRCHDRAFVRLRRALRRAARKRPRDRRTDQCVPELGVSVTKAGATPWQRAAGEFKYALRSFGGLTDYLTLNPGPQRPCASDFFAIVREVCAMRDMLRREGRARTHLFVKLPVAWGRSEADRTLACAAATRGLDGLLISGEGMATPEHLVLLRELRARCPAGTRLFSVGGVRTPRDALRRLQAGADRVQIHAVMRRKNRLRWMKRVLRLLALHPPRSLKGAKAARSPSLPTAD